uniref:Uncharacterized protein n=1 Tax=Ditylenchus dipsaci TaxID=166011 RepID=A0A915E6G0_9BILA
MPGDLIYDVPNGIVPGHILHLTDQRSITNVEAKGQDRPDIDEPLSALSSGFGKFTESTSSVVSSRGVKSPPLLLYGPAARSQTNCATEQKTESTTKDGTKPDQVTKLPTTLLPSMEQLHQSSTEVLKSAKEFLYEAKLDLDEADASLRQGRKNVEVARGLIQESPMLHLCLSSCVIDNKHDR